MPGAAVIVLGLGANRASRWGPPDQAVARCLEALAASRFFTVRTASSLYLSAGVGPGRATRYVNAVVTGDSHLAPEALLSALRRLERAAGPRSAMPWGKRSLDIDLLGYKNRVIGWGAPAGKSARERLTVPHPRLHLRPFVLVPMLEAAPAWRHPVSGLTARGLLRLLPAAQPGQVLQRLAVGGPAAGPALAMPGESA